jgi:hypothetical protein
MLDACTLQAIMLDVEADCYWCLSKLLEGIQDHYTYAQPGIQRTVFRVKELIRCAVQHLQQQQQQQESFGCLESCQHTAAVSECSCNMRLFWSS